MRSEIFLCGSCLWRSAEDGPPRFPEYRWHCNGGEAFFLGTFRECGSKGRRRPSMASEWGGRTLIENVKKDFSVSYYLHFLKSYKKIRWTVSSSVSTMRWSSRIEVIRALLRAGADENLATSQPRGNIHGFADVKRRLHGGSEVVTSDASREVLKERLGEPRYPVPLPLPLPSTPTPTGGSR